MLSRSVSRWSWNQPHTSRAAMPCGEVELAPTASSIEGKFTICLTLNACGAEATGRGTEPSAADGTCKLPSAVPAWRRIGAWTGKELDAGRCWACESRLAAVGVFSSGNRTGPFPPFEADRFNELRFDPVAELGPSDSSSSSSSDPLPPSACSLARRAALTDCCAALLFDFRM